MSVLLELPVPVVEGADLPGLQPAGDAVEVEGVVTHPPGNRALLAGGTRLEATKIIHPAKDVVGRLFFSVEAVCSPGWPGTLCRGP